MRLMMRRLPTSVPILQSQKGGQVRAEPFDGQYVLLGGPSGYVTTPMRCAVCRYDPEFRPKNPWVDHAGDAFTDGGPPATHWAPLPVTEEELVGVRRER